MLILAKIKCGASNNEVKPAPKEETEINANRICFVIHTKARAIQGAANTSVIALLAQYFKVPKAYVKIIRGSKSNIKQIKISTIEG